LVAIVADTVVVLLAGDLLVWDARSVVVAVVVLAWIDGGALETVSGVASFALADVVEYISDES